MFIYKYYEPESVDFILIKEGISLRFTQPEILNDPFELLPTLKSQLDKFEENLEENLSFNEKEYLLKRYSEDLKNKYSNFINMSKGILSLSKNKNSRPMWAYYSKDHSGFLIEFKSRNLKANDNSRFSEMYVLDNLELLNVEYQNSRIDTPSGTLIEFIYRKDKQWEHEQEVRADMELKLNNEINPDSNGYPIFTETLNASHVESIILGVRASPTLERKVRLWAQLHANDVKIKKARLCESKFELIYDRI